MLDDLLKILNNIMLIMVKTATAFHEDYGILWEIMLGIVVIALIYWIVNQFFD